MKYQSIPEVDRTPAQWQAQFTDLATELNANYQKNKLIKGTRTEFLRPILGDLNASHSYFRRSLYNGRYDYNHCFALTLSPRRHTFIEYPLYIGSRFDNDSMYILFDHLGISRKELHSRHGGRRGSTKLVASSMRLAEEKLLPAFLKIIRSRKSYLLECVDVFSKIHEFYEIKFGNTQNAFESDDLKNSINELFGISNEDLKIQNSMAGRHFTGCPASKYAKIHRTPILDCNFGVYVFFGFPC
ncbi:MAG: hypothetical protein KTR19_10410 [Hyphomicrobiales bacterium]|nr:hypothetical protein [Hyphomicrobiales bacterium]